MIILYCLLIISLNINASNPLSELTENKKQQKIQKYEKELKEVFNTLNTSINGLLTTNITEKRIEYFQNIFLPAKKNFDDYFLNAPYFFCNPSASLIRQCFNKLFKPLKTFPENPGPDTLLEDISLKRDLLLETIQYVYKKTDPSYYKESHVTTMPNKPVVYSLRDSLYDLNKELQKLLQVQEDLLEDKTPYITVCKNNLAWAYSQLFSYQTNTEGPRDYAEPENINNNTPPSALVTQITNISDALTVLEKNLINFQDVLRSELPGVGVIGQIKNLADTTKSFIESIEKNSYYVPAQTRESLVGTIKNLTVLCTPQFVEACQTETLFNKLPPTEENKKYIELIYQVRLHETFKNNNQYLPLSAHLSRLEGILYTLGNNTYNTIVTNLTKTITTGIQNNVATPELKKTAAQKEEPASSGYFQLLRNPTEKATKLLDKTRDTGNKLVKEGIEGLEEYAKETKHLTNIHNTLKPPSYFKAMSFIAKKHFKRIRQTELTKNLPVQKINPFVKLYQPYAQENVLKKHSEPKKEEKSDQKNDIPLTNILPVENSNVIHIQNEQPANNNSVPQLEIPVTTEDNRDNALALVVPETKGPKSVIKTLADWIGDQIPSDVLRYRDKFLPLITDLYDRNEKEHTKFKKLVERFQDGPIMDTLKTIDSFANLFNKDSEQQRPIDEIIVLTLPHAVKNYHITRATNDDVELQVLLTDPVFLKEWENQLNQFENRYNDNINTIISSFTTWDKVRAMLHNLKDTDLKPLYEIVKVIARFIEEFIKALFNMDPNNRLKIVKEQRKAFWKHYYLCKAEYENMSNGIKTIKTCLDEALYPTLPLQEEVVA